MQPNTISHFLTFVTSGLTFYCWTRFTTNRSRLVRLCKQFLYIISFDEYTVSKTLFDATEPNLSVSHFRYIWTLFLLLNTFWHEWSRLVTPCNDFLYIISFDVYTVSKTFLMQRKTILQILSCFTSGLYFFCWAHFDTYGHAF
jgi:hypothetical protein